MSFGCKDIKNPLNHKIYLPNLNFFQKKEEKNSSKKKERVFAPNNFAALLTPAPASLKSKKRTHTAK